MNAHVSAADKEKNSLSFQHKEQSAPAVQCKGYEARTNYPLPPIQPKSNGTGLPDKLQAGIENISGYSMDDVQVLYNSDKPAQLQALAYAQGTDIHIAPGQEEHLPHEAWHVVQQKQGRVKATIQMKSSVQVNDDKELEKEANVMGAKALTHQTVNALNKTVEAHLYTPKDNARDWGNYLENNIVQKHTDKTTREAVIQRFATTYETYKENSYTGGTGIEAIVGRKGDWPGGQIPIGGIPPIITDIGAIKGRYVAGHLMNEEIAGLADNPNLTVLSVKSNNTHKGYESKLKMLGHWADFIERVDPQLGAKYGSKEYEHGARYKVEVVDPAPDGSANFIPELLLVSGLKVSITPIRIHKKTGAEEPWPEMSAYKITDAFIPNVPPYPASPGTKTATIAKPRKAVYKDEDEEDDYSGYNKISSSKTTRSGRKSGSPY